MWLVINVLKAHVLLSRVEPLLIDERRPQQSEFTPGRSTSDAVLALRLLSDLHREFSRPLYVAYVDLKSAFDSVDRQALWKPIRGVGITEMLLDLNKDLHRSTHSQVRVGGQLSPPFHTESGVRQGCVLAPVTPAPRVYPVLQSCGLGSKGVPASLWADGVRWKFSDIDYADDIAVVDENQLGLNDTLECMEGACSALGLHVSWTNTKIQNIGAGASPADVVVGSQAAEGLQNFTYLRHCRPCYPSGLPSC